MTDGLHGYLRFDEGKPSIVYDNSDPNESEFVQRATRFYQIYDAAAGTLLMQSDALEPLGVLFTPQEVRALRDRSVHDVQFHDIQTDYGRIRLTNSVITGDNANRRLPAAGRGVPRRLRRCAAPLPTAAAVGHAGRSHHRRDCRPRHGRRRAGPAGAAGGGGADHRRRQPAAAAARPRHRRRARQRGAMPSTTHSRASRTPSARCVSSAPRSRTSCGRRSRRCAARSSSPR